MQFTPKMSAAYALITIAIGSQSLATPMTAVLSLKERVTMQDLAASVLSPVSNRYQQVYSPDEIRNLSAPSESDYQSLLQSLKASGFTIATESPTHLWLSVRGDSSTFEKVFSTQMKFFANGLRQHSVQPSIPSHLSIVKNITGLSNTRRSFPKYVIDKSQDLAKSSGISLDNIKKAYNFDPIYNSGIDGSGQDIAIATYDGFNLDDVRYFYRDQNVSPMSTVDQVNFNGTAAYDENSATETQLDAEFSGMIAPGAKVHVFASAENSDTGETQMFLAILDDNRSKVVNYSWGGCETNLSDGHRDEMANIFARAVAQGVNIMVASGDNGSSSCGDNNTVADWPSANPNVVAVGGTNLKIGLLGNVTETAWSGSGGGISAIWDLPLFQSNLSAPYTKRSYPDVSFNADPKTGQAIWAHVKGKAQYLVIGGTSMAAPQWSGFLTLVASARAKAGKSTLGYLNPVIYALTASEKAKMFRDVTLGSNGAYNASNGWDAVTGWGSMNADALLNRLTDN